MTDILSVIQEATSEAKAFESHPVRELLLEERLLYLQGLSMVMNADTDIHDNEKEYLRILIKSFDMDLSTLDSLVEFSRTPDKDTIQFFFKTFRRRPIAQLFLFDALMLAMRDEQMDKKELEVIQLIAEQLEVLKGTYQDIFDLFCYIKNKDWQESALYFSSHLLNPEHFRHLLAYHEVDLDKLLQQTRNIQRNRLIEVLRAKLNTDDWQWEDLSYSTGDEDFDLPEATEITAQYIDLKTIIDRDILLPALQALLDKGAIRVNQGVVYIAETEVQQGDGDNPTVFFELADSSIAYDSVNRCFYPLPDKEPSLMPRPLQAAWLEQLLPVTKKTEQPLDSQTAGKMINQILGELFKAQLPYAKQYRNNDLDITKPDCPDTVDKKSEEWFVDYTGKLIKTSCGGYLSSRNKNSSGMFSLLGGVPSGKVKKIKKQEDTPALTDILLDGEFRLMRFNLSKSPCKIKKKEILDEKIISEPRPKYWF